MAIGNHTVSYDYRKLHGRIIEKCGKLGAFANLLGISSQTLKNRMYGNCGWKMEDIEKSLDILDLERSEIGLYFFTPRGENK